MDEIDKKHWFWRFFDNLVGLLLILVITAIGIGVNFGAGMLTYSFTESALAASIALGVVALIFLAILITWLDEGEDYEDPEPRSRYE